MQRLIPSLVFLAGVLPMLASAQGKKADSKCVPRVVTRPQNNLKEIKLRPGVTIKQDPVIAFEILESGNVVNPRVERSSGVTEIDTYALNWVRSAKFKQRPGCGVLESKMSVTIDFR